ncbi:MAG TPA: HesA/MoeB/ThiF family protein [Candidatus Competibacter sp.]|nr:molybdenum cofactor biosynthesis protein MoeB [Candidatus Competibacteraceae bacterium]HRC73685.1 HesA/MoeB/ThiF family protein [Candidatus Competibacter sp.]
MIDPIQPLSTMTADDLSPEEQLRYARQMVLPEVGAEGQRKLRRASVLVIGAGGLGAPALLYLAAAGVGRLGIIDPDRVELSNLQRQVLYDATDCGGVKVEQARQHLLALNPNLRIDVYPEAFTLANAAGLIAAYDLVIEGSDRFATKYLVNDACVLAGNKPCIGASIRSFAGMLAVYAAPGGPCYRCLFPEMPDPATVPSCAQAGVLGTVPGLFGVLQAHEALKLILGVGEPLVGALLTVDLLTMRLQKLRLPRDPHCVICGDTPAIVALAETGWACAAQVADATDEASAEDAAISADGLPWLSVAASRRRPSLRWLDIRTRAEFDAGHVPGAEHAPLDQLDRFAERAASTTGEFLLYCQGGARTVRAYALLGQRLPGRLWLLRGGYDAWLRDRLATTAPNDGR